MTGTQTNYEFRGEQDMNTQKELNDDEVRVIKISKEALFEFIYEKFIDDQDLYLDVDPLDVTNVVSLSFVHISQKTLTEELWYFPQILICSSL